MAAHCPEGRESADDPPPATAHPAPRAARLGRRPSRRARPGPGCWRSAPWRSRGSLFWRSASPRSSPTTKTRCALPIRAAGGVSRLQRPPPPALQPQPEAPPRRRLAGPGATLFLGYAFRDEAAALWNRLAGELVPSRGTVADGVISFPARPGRAFHGRGAGQRSAGPPDVDTGASTVVLSPADAKRLGFDLTPSPSTPPSRPANGIVRGAPVRLGRMVLGPIAMTDVRASVNGAPMRDSLSA